MPGLLRGVARTAAIAGTASAVSGRVQRRQAERFATRDANIYAERKAAYVQQAPPQAAEPAPVATSDETIRRLKELAALKADGILTEDEFATQKARILST